MNMQSFLHTYLKTSWQVDKLAGDSGERKYSRISSANRSYILVNYPCVKKGFDNFVHIQRTLAKHQLATPEILKTDRNKGLILLEDIGGNDLETNYLKNKTLTQHKHALDVLYLFQKKIKKLKTKFTKDQGFSEMMMSYQNLGHALVDSQKICLFKEFHEICHHLGKNILVPSHRDFHSRNLFVYKDQIYIIDFQDAGWYPRYYDLVSLIYDSYLPLSQTERQKLIQYYKKKWNEKVCLSDLYLTFCQRGFKAIGSFMSFYHLRRQTKHLKYVKPTLINLRKTLLRLRRYPYFLDYVNRVLGSL